MTHPKGSRLFEALSTEAAAAAQRALDAPDPESAEERWAEAFASVEFPEGEEIPLPRDLSSAQRALAELSATCQDVETWGFALPHTAERRRRWLGLEPGELEALVRLEHDGARREEPLWYALRSTRDDTSNIWEQILEVPATILGSLPMQRRLAALGELFCERAEGRWPYDIEGDHLVLHPRVRLVAELADEGGTWAAEMADELLRQASKIAEPNPRIDAGWACYHSFGSIRWAVFLALARARVPIEPRWEPLLPLASRGPRVELMRECLRAIGDRRRGTALTGVMKRMYATEIIDLGCEIVQEFPSPDLVALIMEKAPESRRPQRLVHRSLKTLLREHPDLVAQVEAVEARLPKIPTLECTQVWTATRLEQLSALQQEQLEHACKRWDGDDLPLEARFTGENEEARVVGELEVCEIHDVDGGEGYTAYLLGHDSGTVFRRGTTEVVAEMVQGSLRSRSKKRLEALQLALHDKPSVTRR